MVTRTTIETAIAQGARTVEEVGLACAAGTDCGKCQRTIQRLLTLAETPQVPAQLRTTGEQTRGA